MKQLVKVAVVVGVVFVLAGSSPGADIGKVSLGVKGGLSVATLSGDSLAVILQDMASWGTAPDKASRVGFGAGAFVCYSVTPTIAVQPELLYIQKGAKFEFSGTDGGKMTARSAWLEMPLLLKFTPVTGGGRLTPTLFAGPFVALSLSAEFQQHGFAESVPVPPDFDTKDSLKSTDFGITFGGGSGYRTGWGEVFFDIRYDLGLTKIMEKGTFDRAGSEADTKTRALLVFVGCRFGV